MSVDLAYEITGPADAPVVVLLSSLGSTRAMWDAQLGPLSAHLRVVRTDLRGHGRSPVPAGPYTMAELGGDVLALLDTLGAQRAHLVGVSLGGMAAQWVAIHAPERVSSLSLLSTTAGFDDAAAWHERAATVRAQGVAALAPMVAQRWFTPELAQRDPELMARTVAMISATPAEGYAGCSEAIAGWGARADLGRITARTLVISGAEDPSTPPAMSETIAAGVAGAELQTLSPAAHLLNIEQAGRVTQLLLAHILGEHAGRVQERAAGMRTRRAVLGDAHVDGALAATTQLTAPFQDFITRVAWGEVWNRPGLDHATRSVITLTALTALGNEHELAMHVRAARRNGLSAEQIGEVLLHTAIYAGVPRSNRAFAIAQKVLDVTENDD